MLYLSSYPVSAEESLDAFWIRIHRIPCKVGECTVVRFADETEIGRSVHRP